MDHGTDKIPTELIKQFAKGNGSVFVGAGLSMGAGLPSWKQLIEPLTRQLTEEILDKNDGASADELSRSSLTDLAQYYENLIGRKPLFAHVSEALDIQRARPTGIHEKLVNLPLKRFFTTNFDNLLEDACRNQRLTPRTIFKDSQLAAMNTAPKIIVKLHGDLNDDDSLVLTTSDYEDYFDKNPGIANLLALELHSRTVLFVGYSFNDMDLRMILNKVTKSAGRLTPSLFALQPNPTELEKSELGRRGIKVIKLVATCEETTERVNSWLEEFARSVRESPCRPPGLQSSSGFIGSNIRSRSGDSTLFLDRRAELAKVLQGLRSRYPLVAIRGSAGVGKTSLAIQVAHECSRSRGEISGDTVTFDYIVWLSAEDRPYPKSWLDEVLNVIATTLKHPAILQEQNRQNKVEQVRQLLTNYTVLVALDNFEAVDEDRELVEWLADIPSPSRALIATRESRSQPDSLPAWLVNLRGLEMAEAVDLMRQLLPQGLADQTLHCLAETTDGNPQAMKLAIGLVQDQKGIADLERLIQQLTGTQKDPDKIFRLLFSGVWERLLEPARKVLASTALFATASSISRDALQATAGLPSAEFAQGLDQCLRFELLEREEDRFVIHRQTRAFARSKLEQSPDWKRGARRQYTDYFLQFVRERVVRPQPNVPYWNALVSPRMAELSPEWPSIQQAMSWAGDDQREDDLIDFVMLLVHYMDSQFLNTERLKYVRRAAAALGEQQRHEEEALLRIDALGWTYVEERDLPDAEREIFRGLEIAQSEDLRALGAAWMGRVKVEGKEKDFAKADEWIQKARVIRCSPWIRFRVHMAAGDIELKRGPESAQKALDFYRLAEGDAESYGGEGYGYQIVPRLGLALLGMGRIKEAEERFRGLSELEQIPIGKLYAEYGLALVTSKGRSHEEALEMLADVKAKLSQYTKSNLLLRLIEEQEVRMAASQESGEGKELSLPSRAAAPWAQTEPALASSFGPR